MFNEGYSTLLTVNYLSNDYESE